jgi:hypothetical protein
MALTKVTTHVLADNAVTSAKLAENAITAREIATNALITLYIADNGITSVKIAENNVTAREIAQNIITVAHLADSAVETAKINADAVTGAKIADDAIDSEHYTDLSIDTAHIANNAITAAKLPDNVITATMIPNATNLTLGTVTAALTGNASGTAATVTTAAQTNITSLGTLTGLTVNGLTKFDQYSSSAGHGRIEFGNSGEPYIQAIDVGNGGSGAYLKFGINATDVIYINDDFTVGVGTTSPVTGLTVATSANITQTALTSSSSAVAWNAKTQGNAYHVTTENTTFAAPSNANEGAIISVEIAQGGTARTIAWNTVFEFAASTAPTVTATASKTDIFSFRYNGSVWQEIGRVQNMAQT